jgi:hypothetical protein
MVAEDDRFAPADTISWNDAGEELTLFDSAGGSYFALNGPAVAIWREFAAGRSVGEVIATLTAHFNCPSEVVAGDVALFVRAALDRHLIVARG